MKKQGLWVRLARLKRSLQLAKLSDEQVWAWNTHLDGLIKGLKK